jgi:hypothetical protein
MNIFGKLIATISLISILPFVVLAYTDSSRIGATVKISICGDNLVEGKEDCEKGLGVQFDCKDFGYMPKSISCDISCAYDLLSCTPIKTVTTPIDEKENKEEDIEPSLPRLMTNWDKNNDGILTMDEFTSFITNWVNNWKSFIVLPKENSEKETVTKECDINSDKTCNVTDFSIILYYLNND